MIAWGLLQAGFLSLDGARLEDPDSFMRLVRIEELFRSGNWFDSVIRSEQSPASIDLHWTRPFDLLLVLTSAPLLFLGWETALFWSGVFISPILFLASALMLPWALAPMRWRSPLPLMVAFIAQPSILERAMPGRADHHSLQMLLFVILLGTGIRAFQAETTGRLGWGAIAGVVAGMGVWVSLEMAVPAAILAVILSTRWVMGAEGAWRVTSAYATGLLGLLVLALVSEYAPAAILTEAYDKVSYVHVLTIGAALSLWLLLGWTERIRPARSRAERAMRLAATSALLVLVVAAMVPRLLDGPGAAVDPRIFPVWLDLVAEMQPLWPFGGQLPSFFWYGAAAALCCPFGAWVLWRARGSRDGWAWFWLLALQVVLLVLTAHHLRSGLFLGITTAVFVAAFAEAAYERIIAPLSSPFRSVAHVVLLSTVYLSFPGLAAVTAASDGRVLTEDDCDLAAVAHALQAPQQFGQQQLIVASLIDYGPELMYRTSHFALSGPYHRNHETILDARALFLATSDGDALAIVDKWNVGLLLVCGTAAEKVFFHSPPMDETTLHERLVAGNAPTWLRPVAIDESNEGRIKLLEVVR